RTVHRVVAHDKVVARPNPEFGSCTLEEFPQVVCMPGILIFRGRDSGFEFFGIESIHVLEERHGRIQTHTVDYHVAIVTNAKGFTAEANQSFDVMGTGREPEKRLPKLINNPGRLKDDDFTRLRTTEIVSDPIHEQAIAAGHFEADDHVSFPKRALGNRGPFLEFLRRKPDRIYFIPDFETLPFD